jgi:WD40 repeat protein
MGHYTIRLWDLLTGRAFHPHNPSLEYRLTGYFVEKNLDFVKTITYNQQAYIIFGAPKGELRVLYHSGLEVDCWVVDRNSLYYARAAEVIVIDTGILVIVGNENGTLAIRDILNNRDAVEERFVAHKSGINVVAQYHCDRHQIVLTGGDDGNICFGDLHLRKFFQIVIESPVYSIQIVQEKLFVCTEAGVCMLAMDWPVICKLMITPGN